MGRLDQEERHTLLPLSSSNNSNSTNDYISSGDDPSEDENSLEFRQKTKYFRKTLAGAILRSSSSSNSHKRGLISGLTLTNNRRKLNNVSRGGLGKRFIRFLFCAFMIPMSLFLILYCSLFSGSSSRQYPLPDWDFDVSRNISDYVLPLNETTLLEPHNKCNDKFFLLIIVCSGLNNFEARQTIRETWGNTTEFNYQMFEKLHAHMSGKYLQPKKQRLKFYHEYLKMNGNQTSIIPPATIPVRVVFLLGQSKQDSAMYAKNGPAPGEKTTNGVFGNETLSRLRQEADQYDDIIQEQFIDSYNNLTIKSVMALKWIQSRGCYKQSAFFMKVDDDTFVNIPNLLHFLLGGTVPLYNDTLDYYDSNSFQTLSSVNRLNATKDYMVGYKFCKAPVLSNVKSKWYMPYYMYQQNEYPHYLSGSGYLMSMDVVPKLYKAALNTSLIYLEDVYVTVNRNICVP
ncbi:lactosylceramide 1,3-N-acetyl-beta-D-glucosaminyltransferase A-like isoform X2 [Haematobia irritans]|uniref:lactosylceramide 1,3-N-acetyl-beta-D-glucosaminyltransferase A-like isoform X2 n=2 Tax=Haematobia irritans TaxID=7368 RepID=UPI003F4F914C